MQFNPWAQSGSNVSQAATASSSVAAQLLAAPAPTAAQNVRVMQDGTTTGYIKFGDSTVGAATSADIPILGGTERLLQFPPGATHFTVIMRSGTANFDVSLGLGA